MAVTTREYNLATSRPKDVLQALHDALTDLNWFEPQPMGYLCNFVNTPGSVIKNRANDRYLVAPTTTTAPAGNGAVFEVFRSPVGAISAVTLVTGGEGYYIRGAINAASTGSNVTIANTSGINVGMVVTRVAGTGSIVANTVVSAVVNSSVITLDSAPSPALSGATLSFADTITIAANTIGGNTYTMAATGTSGQTNLAISNTDSVFIGQRVTGTGVANLAVVTAITGNVVTLSKSHVGTVSGNVTFSDEIVIITTGIANAEDLTGFASGLTISNVASNSNIYAGATLELQSGTPTWDADNGRVIISTITGSGPYTITLRNEENTFKGFDTTGNITFKVSSGTNVNWFEIDTITAPQTYTWAVGKIKNGTGTGKLRHTFWLFYVGYNTTLYNGVILNARPLTGFNPLTNTAQGVAFLDWLGAATPVTTTAFHFSMPVASSPYVTTLLRTRQSGIDSNFTTFAFFEGNNNRNPFFISKYDTNYQPWSLDDVFLGGITEVFQLQAFNTSDTGILFRQRMNVPKRMAEAGYGNYNLVASATGAAFTNTYYRSVTGNRIQQTPVAAYDDVALYSRQTGDVQTALTTQYPVYRTIPINPHFLPVPYYLPDDFVLVELPWLNASIGDTITVSAGEVYKIVQVATNQLTLTSLAFCARIT